MKKTRIFKCITMFTLALLTALAIGIATSAETPDTYNIKKVSVTHGERTFVLMAVDVDIEDADSVEVKYTIDDEEYVAKRYVGNYVDKATEVAYPVYYTHGISPQDIGEDIIAEAHKVGAVDYTPVEYNVCIAEYLYNQLYAEGLISATGGYDLSYKILCQAHLSYGAAAQQALHNEKPENEGNQRVLITERSYVYSAYATINGTNSKEIILPEKNGTVTLTANENAPADRVGWVVTTYAADGSTTIKEFKEDVVEITGHSVITPLLRNVIDFENAQFGAVTGIENVTHKTNITDNDSSAAIVNDPIVEEGISNKVLHMDANGDNVDWDGGNVGIDINVENVQDGANCYILDFDILMLNAATTHDSTIQISFLNATSEKFCFYGLKNIKGASLTVQKCVSGSSFGTIVTGRPVGEWVNVRMEYYSDIDKVKLFINEVYMDDVASLYGSIDDSTIKTLRFYSTGECCMDVYLDNIVAEAVVKAYVAGNPQRN